MGLGKLILEATDGRRGAVFDPRVIEMIVVRIGSQTPAVQSVLGIALGAPKIDVVVLVLHRREPVGI